MLKMDNVFEDGTRRRSHPCCASRARGITARPLSRPAVTSSQMTLRSRSAANRASSISSSSLSTASVCSPSIGGAE